MDLAEYMGLKITIENLIKRLQIEQVEQVEEIAVNGNKQIITFGNNVMTFDVIKKSSNLLDTYIIIDGVSKIGEENDSI